MKFVLYLIEHQTIHLKKLFIESLDGLCNDFKNLSKDKFIWLMSDECETGNFCKLFLQLFSTEKSLVFHWECNRFILLCKYKLSFRNHLFLYVCMWCCIFSFFSFVIKYYLCMPKRALNLEKWSYLILSEHVHTLDMCT